MNKRARALVRNEELTLRDLRKFSVDDRIELLASRQNMIVQAIGVLFEMSEGKAVPLDVMAATPDTTSESDTDEKAAGEDTKPGLFARIAKIFGGAS